MGQKKEPDTGNSALVIGAGIGGIKAAIDLAESGFYVHMIDDAPYIGGALSKLDRQFPTNDCGMCQMLPSFVSEYCSEICLRRGLDHPNIDIMTGTEIKGLSGKAGKFKPRITKKARLVDSGKCIACNLCVDVCPIDVKDEFNQELGNRKAIHIQFPSAVPKVYTIDTKNCNQCGECVEICPTRAINLSNEDEDVELKVGAIILAMGFTPFDPSEIGALHYSEFQNVVTALEFERVFSGTGPNSERQLSRISDDRIPESIAFIQCVGSRDEKRPYCSFACCMHSLKEAMLVKELYPDTEVTIFFMDVRAFGKGYHRYYEKARKMGIKFVRSRIADIWEVESNNLQVNYSDEFDAPKRETFEMVVLATGQDPPKRAEDLSKILGIDLDENLFCSHNKFSAVETSKEGVFSCGSFSGPKDIPDTIIEASAAACLAGSILRKGMDKKEDLHEKETESESDTSEDSQNKINESESIGIFICRCGTSIADSLQMDEILEFSKNLLDVEYARNIDFLCLELEEIKKRITDANVGKVIFAACSPYPFIARFKKAVAEAGIDPSLLEIVDIREGCAWIHKDKQKATEKAKALIAMDIQKLRIQDTLQIKTRSVIPRALVIGGGISGMISALQIANNGINVDILEKSSTLGGNAGHLYRTPHGLNVEEFLVKIIGDVENNDLIRILKNSEVVKVSGKVGDFKVEITPPSGDKKEEYGAVIVATGANELETEEYLYGKQETVISQRELEKRIIEEDLRAKSLVMIQCVGLRDDNRHYCGRVCCLGAIKNALRIKEIEPDTDVYILYRDIMTYGLNEEYYLKAKEKGVNFIRYELENKPKVNMKKRELEIGVRDPVLNEDIMIKPDLLVLSLGPYPGNNMAILDSFEDKLRLDEDGFISQMNLKFRPIDFLSEGIFVCGLAHAPRNLIESIAQAQAAAGRALSILSRNEIPSRAAISEVNERWCVGCEACIVACPYEARILDTDKKVAKVVDVLCKGCGICAVVCPSNAASLKGHKEKQIMAMIDEAIV
ncbi:MAG: CoB--CoM heterodisulfide reductase iron-sulfur subunit A family protein [Thermoplasmata archaeon]|nr:MAG: CoB--CoM heterodisulfide reductase iron-sulfur subunit A family protein [Thermoplasmata archaeon]